MWRHRAKCKVALWSVQSGRGSFWLALFADQYYVRLGPGKGKARNRRFRMRKGPLIVRSLLTAPVLGFAFVRPLVGLSPLSQPLKTARA